MQLRVMSFNVLMISKSRGPHAWETRRDLLVATIQEKAPDVLGAQEVFADQGRYIVERLPGYAWFGASRFGDKDDAHAGIFYRPDRLRLLEAGDFWLSETPESPVTKAWGMHMPRTATWGLFETLESARRFYHYNTHFPHRPEDAGARVQCAELIAGRIAALPREVPAILTGDFNSEPREQPYQVLRRILEDARADAARVSGPEGTMHEFEEPEGPRYDWILYRGLRPLEFETVTRNEQGRRPSDHYPVFALFELE